jgi:hypothetical protein
MHSNSNLVITDEVFLAEDEPLVELTFGCDTANIYDSLVRMSNIMSKNAKSSNHMEDIVNNLKLFVETNVGKLTRLSNTLDEANRTLQAQVVKLQDEIRLTKESCLRKDEYEVDIRRVKNQLHPCVTFLEDVESKKCYSLDMYIREVLKCDMQSVYLTPLKAQVDATTAALMDASNNKMSIRISKQREELQEVLVKQTDRVNTELRSIQELVRLANEDRDTNKAMVDDTIASLKSKIQSSVDEMQAATEEQSKHFAKEMAALDERQKKVVELLGFRESSAGGVVGTGGGGSALAGSANLANFSGISNTPLSPMLFVNNAAPQMNPGIPNYNFPTSPLSGSAIGGDNSQAIGQMFLSMLAASGFQDQTLVSDDGDEGGGLIGVQDANSEGSGHLAEAGTASGSPKVSTKPPLDQNGGSRTKTTKVVSPTNAGSGSVRLLARGKSILQTNNPQQQTGLFGTQMFRQFSQLLHGDMSAIVDELEVKLRTDMEVMEERLEALIAEKMDKVGFEEHIRSVPSAAPRDVQLHQQVDGLLKQVEGIKKLRVDLQALTTTVEKKADAASVNGKAAATDLTTMQQEMERVFQEMSASMTQVHQVLRKTDLQMKSFHNGLAEHGILMSAYSGGGGGGGGGGNSPGLGGGGGSFTVEHSLAHNHSSFMGGGGSAHASRLSGNGDVSHGHVVESGFPSISTGIPPATRKAALPMRSSSARSGASPSPSSGEIRDIGSAHRSHPSQPSSARGILPSGSSSSSRAPYSSGGAGGPPGLHEVVFEMSASTFEVHKKKSETEKRPIVAPRPPSLK